MKSFLHKVKAMVSLGPLNLMRVAGYRLGIRYGFNQVCHLKAEIPRGPFYNPIYSVDQKVLPIKKREIATHLFGYLPIFSDTSNPDWMVDQLTAERSIFAIHSWWKIPDFNGERDIKSLWEFSRMDWVLTLAQIEKQGGEGGVDKLNSWLSIWCHQNRPYFGPNWKCGQEASIRVMYLAMAALVLGQIHESTKGLRDMIMIHLQRIAPTLQYAIAQDNNHGTSEAAALFIGGSWLAILGDPRGDVWAQNGRFWLENRAQRLIGDSGSFSQYSLNYHRMMLDTFCMVEIWRKRVGLPTFSDDWYKKIQLATEWLRHIINPLNGDGPNVGANDGAHLLRLPNASYRDYRPAVHLASVIFLGRCAYDSNPLWDDSLCLFGIDKPGEIASKPGDYVADDAGFIMLRRRKCMLMLRYPRFKFRPSHADALHLDFWLADKNVLRDSGTYSYNADAKLMDYFGGTASHNTVQFDGRNQMPRLSRFLFGCWLKTDVFEPLTYDAIATKIGAGYKDWQGAQHLRRITFCDDSLSVTDEVCGFRHKAVLRWRLLPGSWKCDAITNGVRITGEISNFVLEVRSSVGIIRAEIINGLESLHYLEKTNLPVLEVEINQPGIFSTNLTWIA